MRDITVKILSDGTAQVTEPTCFSGEHNAARLCITLSDELASLDYSYCLLAFDVYGLGRKIISNLIEDESSTPAYRESNVIYCPLPEALTSTGELSVQVEAHRLEGTETVKVFKSSVFTLKFEPSITGCDEELEERCGILPQLAAAVAKMLEFEGFSDGEDGTTFIPYVSSDGTLSWTNDGGLDNPVPVNVRGSQGEKGEKGEKGDTGEIGPRGASGVYIVGDGERPEGTVIEVDFDGDDVGELLPGVTQEDDSKILQVVNGEWVAVESRNAEIDENTNARHTHKNNETLDKFGELGGQPTFDGQPIGGVSDISADNVSYTSDLLGEEVTNVKEGIDTVISSFESAMNDVYRELSEVSEDSHEHMNKDCVDRLNENYDGYLTYNGKIIGGVLNIATMQDENETTLFVTQTQDDIDTPVSEMYTIPHGTTLPQITEENIGKVLVAQESGYVLGETPNEGKIVFVTGDLDLETLQVTNLSHTFDEMVAEINNGAFIRPALKYYDGTWAIGYGELNSSSDNYLVCTAFLKADLGNGFKWTICRLQFRKNSAGETVVNMSVDTLPTTADLQTSATDFVTASEMETYVSTAINGSLDEVEALIDESGVLA